MLWIFRPHENPSLDDRCARTNERRIVGWALDTERHACTRSATCAVLSWSNRHPPGRAEHAFHLTTPFVAFSTHHVSHPTWSHPWPSQCSSPSVLMRQLVSLGALGQNPGCRFSCAARDEISRRSAPLPTSHIAETDDAPLAFCATVAAGACHNIRRQSQTLSYPALWGRRSIPVDSYYAVANLR